MPGRCLETSQGRMHRREGSKGQKIKAENKRQRSTNEDKGTNPEVSQNGADSCASRRGDFSEHAKQCTGPKEREQTLQAQVEIYLATTPNEFLKSIFWSDPCSILTATLKMVLKLVQEKKKK